MNNTKLSIIKRDGDSVEFDKSKVENAILKAMKYGSGIYVPQIANQIAIEIEEFYTESGKTATVYKVEEMVYDKLINYRQQLTAKAYEGYRAVQSFKRTINTTDDRRRELWDKSNEDVWNENSNKNGILASTQWDLVAGEI